MDNKKNIFESEEEKQDIIKQLEILKSAIEWDYSLEYQLALDKAINSIKSQLNGRLIEQEDECRCNICSHTYKIQQLKDLFDGKYPNNCPNCGAILYTI